MSTNDKLVVPAQQPTVLPVAGSDAGFPVRRVYCVGRNYVEHAKEMGFTGREPPFFFMKPADALLFASPGKTTEMPYPVGTSNLHHEMELVVAIGSAAKDVKAAEARKHIYGYAVGLDMTRRDLQGEAKKTGRPWEIGKAFDQSGPIGPVVPADQVGDIDNAALTFSVNGEQRQAASVAELIWNIDEIIEHLSGFWELMPGDLIFTGTPAGVAAVEKGDLMEGSVTGVGEISIKVV
ncbi:MAG: fumarylacetoacetate hydrolase family protein [Burkholderiaceae bacterium]